MSKHAMARSRRLSHLKVAGSVLLVVAFVVLLVGSATGKIGQPGGGAPSTAQGPSTGGAQPASQDHPSPSPSPSAEPTADPTSVVTDVPPQDVKGAKKLKHTLAWLRRGLADQTTFRVGTLNVLGNSHTAPGGNRKGWASGYTRMGWAWSIISQADLSVVGFQELEDVQYNRMRALSGWDAYPGPTLDSGSIRYSIAWNPAVWKLVEANSIGIPYVHGQIIRRPVVKLENIASGRDVWFFNTQNPATTPAHGNNARWRAAGIQIEIQLANQLSADGTPVVFTGDYNDRDAAFCPLVGGTSLVAANGGSNDGSCQPPDHMDVDWIFGSGVQWQQYVSASQGITGRVTDHPFVYAQGYIPEEPLGGEPTDAASPSESPSSGG